MQRGHEFSPAILREYDIRGTVGETLGGTDAFFLGRALAGPLGAGGGRRVVVGRDGRLHSPGLASSLCEGFLRGGLEVTDIGVGPTPMLYFAVHHLDCAGGVMVTGSHNPPRDNGFKIMVGKRPFFGRDIQALGDAARRGDFPSGTGKYREQDVSEAYLGGLLPEARLLAPDSVVWDTGNGAAGDILGRLLAHLPGQHHLLFGEIDGRFPNHHPDPTVPENLGALRREVAGRQASCGLALDGDGDRIGAVDSRGRIIWGDQLLLLLARDLLRDRPGAEIIADVKSSQVFFDQVARAGGIPVMYRTGHSLIKERMAATGAPLAGEMSGHLFLADRYHGFDDALYAGLRILGALRRLGMTAGEFLDSLPVMQGTPELRIPAGNGPEIVRRAGERLAQAGAEVTTIDGVRVRTRDGWWLLRASNTQPVLVARCEAEDRAGLDALLGELEATLLACGGPPLPASVRQE